MNAVCLLFGLLQPVWRLVAWADQHNLCKTVGVLHSQHHTTHQMYTGCGADKYVVLYVMCFGVYVYV